MYFVLQFMFTFGRLTDQHDCDNRICLMPSERRPDWAIRTSNPERGTGLPGETGGASRLVEWGAAMRLPRVRFTIRWSLIGVALVGLNLAAAVATATAGGGW